MNTQKLESIILHLNRYQKLPEDAVEDALIALNLALLVAQEEYPLPEPSRAKDTPEPEPLPLSLRDIRKMEGITQDTLAQRIPIKMNLQKLESIIWHINRYQKIPDDAIQDTLIALNLALLVAQEELPRAKDTPSKEFRLCSLADLRNKVGITQESLAQRMRENGREIKFQGDIMKLERGYNSPTVSRLKDYVEALGYTLDIIASKDGSPYPLDVNALTRSRTKDARKK